MELAELDKVLEILEKQNVMQFSFQKLNLGDIEMFRVIMQLKSFRKPPNIRVSLTVWLLF